ncbi:MAG: SpoIIE family protein phosphatase [Tannerella sp.]|jgi:ligand-binding sensor domain-containing protein/serine phosphatase RsbU (regulator of sigma subunit)|nr:SpoIIE family protein phosphatase [Tannerella sp.]
MKGTSIRSSLIITILLLCSFTGHTQVYKFQQYKYSDLDNGICHNSVYSIIQDKNGFIWFATGLGLCRYDGFRFESPDEEEIPVANVVSSFQDSSGDLWFGYDDGLVVRYDGVDFFFADTSKTNTSINQILQSPNGEIVIVTQTEGITRIKDDQAEYLSEGLEDKFLYSACFIDETKLFIGANDGLYVYRYPEDNQPLVLLERADTLADVSVQKVVRKRDGNGFWIVTENNGIYFATMSADSMYFRQLDIPELEDAYIQSVYEDDRNNLWVSSYQGLFRIRISTDLTVERLSRFDSSNGLGSNYVKCIFFDNQQNLWVGTLGQGAASLTNMAISFFEPVEAINNNATAVFSVDDSEYWIAGMGTVVKIEAKPNRVTTIFGRAQGIPNEKISALYVDVDGNLWIGTERSGLYRMAKGANNASEFFRDRNSLSNTIQSITCLNGEIWIATQNGVFILDAGTGAVRDHYDTAYGYNETVRLPHNNIKNIFKDSEDIIWIATTSNALLSVNSEQKIVIENEAEIEFTSITEDRDGNLWAGSRGRGIYLFERANDSITVEHFTTEHGLMSNYCYAIAYDGNNYIWAGHQQGLSCINVKRRTVTTYGFEYGLTGDVNNNAMMLNNSGELLVGTTDGVMIYSVKADQKGELVPMLNLAGVSVNDKKYNRNKALELPYDQYKVQFDFIGLQYANSGSVTYQYVLQGYEREWSSPVNLNSVIYPRLENGEYKFWVRACNSDNCTEETMLFTLKIRKPFWKTWWFIILEVLLVIGSVYLIVAIRERNHRIQQEYLERELAERTKEVREQKEEIETKNRDITDSINYAQRIQFSVLPSTSTLLENCSGAFIFYRPRDIVSGDFYWFDYVPETQRLLIVCADSTGHGVPGAFMSLIGTTLIKDIASRSDIKSPSDILYRLDENVHSTLNQNRDSEQANDGMDLIVCEINTETKYVKIASAMRPVVIYRNGVPTTYKCNRFSIGGGQSINEKIFDTIEIQLSVGDTIYMFTDGYADQFGGPSGKKFKLNRLQSILNDIHYRDINEQYRVVKENFDLWKGDLDQVDDVLLIGVKV